MQQLREALRREDDARRKEEEAKRREEEQQRASHAPIVPRDHSAARASSPPNPCA